MSMRMNAFLDIVNSYSKPGMGINGNASGVCKNDGPSDAAMVIGGILNVGMTAATMALQAKTEAQNQQASNSNAAINNAMKDAQDALRQLPANSNQYAKLQNQINDLQTKLDAIDNYDKNNNDLKSFEENVVNTAKTSSGKNLNAVICDIQCSKVAVGQLDKFLATANDLQRKQTLNEKIADAEVKPTFSKYAGTFVYSGNNLGQAKSFIETKRGEYKTQDKDGKENFLEAIYKQDLQAAEAFDKQYAEKITAQNEVEKIKGQKTQLFKNATAVLTKATEGGSTIANIEQITSIETLQNAINQINSHVQSIEAETVTGEDGKTMTAGECLDNLSNLKNKVNLYHENKNNKATLEAEKAKLEKQLEDSVKPQLQKLSKSYNDLDAILVDIKKCEDAKAEVKEAKADYKDVKRADNKNRSFFQEVFGLNKDKETRGYAKSAIAREKEEATQAEKDFAAAHKGAKLTESFKRQVVTQMNTIAKTILDDPTLKALADKYGYAFKEIEQ